MIVSLVYVLPCQVLDKLLPAYKKYVAELRPRHVSMLARFDVNNLLKVQDTSMDDKAVAALFTFFLTEQAQFRDTIHQFKTNPPSPPPPPPAAATPQAPPPPPAAATPQAPRNRPDNPNSRKHNAERHAAVMQRATQKATQQALNPTQVAMPPKAKRKRRRKRKKPHSKPPHQSSQPPPYKAATFTLLPTPQLQLCSVKLTNTTLKEVRPRLVTCGAQYICFPDRPML